MKKILITCDTELGELSKDINNAFEIFIEGKVFDKTVGYTLINEIANEYKAIVTHFVDAYPCEFAGDKKFAILCNSIMENGHKIELHTHPSSKFDRRRRYLHQYNEKEQQKIIAFGKKKIYEWTGYEVSVHRAGGYGINYDTFQVLKDEGIVMDTSFLHGNEVCLYKAVLYNAPFQVNGILEIPITVYQRDVIYWPGIKKSCYQKLDFRYGSNAQEILSVIAKMPMDSIIILFLHSFNFLNLPYNFRTAKYGEITVNKNLIEQYHKVLQGLKQNKDCVFCCFSDLNFDEQYDDFLVNITQKGKWSSVLQRKLDKIINKKGNV
ncbi:polysaccharide deacetylase family protein [Propionispora hippei]|uniref:Polysaccharide deacetylase n=1 Tax=Propionispora hippei DSM 15287 TaxID=1123003 RepID=A0A1M6K2C2_9FIRM|nr:hypothetical protein [Propionispora hippei]SHJ53126.1 hypothetical protein SAMN02745170_02751 [Propionispora hippei DSM 15287]